ncbi:putative ribonuclease H-like domain-containing protein [Tanacetum coccineum]
MPVWKDASYFEDASLKSVDGVDDHQVNTASPQVNTASPQVNTGSRELSTADFEVNTATFEGLMGPIPTTEDTQEEEQGIDLGNLSPSYAVSSTSYSELGFLHAIYDGKAHQDLHTCLFACFLSQEEPKRVSKALNLPKVHRAIGTKWVYRNKKDERGIVMMKFLLQWLELRQAIRIFLAYASYMGFEDPDHPDKVYTVMKALYGLHQTPRAWYDTLATYLLSNGFQRGKIDQTLFIKSQKGHILLVQIYVDDIIFGSTKKELCEEFETLMKDKFQMSSMGKDQEKTKEKPS